MSDGDQGDPAAIPSFVPTPRRVHAHTTTMPPHRRNRSPAPSKGLAPGESLKRFLVPTRNPQSALWAWVGSEVSQAADITTEHCLMTCGLSVRCGYPFCMNKYGGSQLRQAPTTQKHYGTGEDDIIIISDDEEKCTKRSCKDNPNCLNYLGQDKWEDEGMANKCLPSGHSHFVVA